MPIIERRYYMVRARNQENLKTFFDEDVVGVGWSNVDFTKKLNDDVGNTVKNQYYSNGITIPQIVGKKLSEVDRFLNIKKGDIIIVPYHNSIRIAEATGNPIYDSNYVQQDLANQQKVIYQCVNDNYKVIPRNTLSDAFQRKLRVRGVTVANLDTLKNEIDAIFSKDSYNFVSEFNEKEEYQNQVFRSTLLSNIRSGKTNFQSGGIGLENLVKELLECEGYTASICSKNKFAGIGDADIEAIKSDKLQEQKILVQVKHHNGYSGIHGIKQLEGIMNTQEYNDYAFVFVTSAMIPDDVAEEGEKLNIQMIGGTELIEWLIEHLDHISDETKMQLGISAIPQLLF